MDDPDDPDDPDDRAWLTDGDARTALLKRLGLDAVLAAQLDRPTDPALTLAQLQALLDAG